MPQVEIFTPTGVVSGTTSRAAVERDGRGAPRALSVEASRWYPLDGGEPERRETVIVPPDEILLVVLGPPAFTLHASWYPIELDVGPYRVEGHLPVAPGFDPARALARPTGPFVDLRDLTISIPGVPGAGIAERPHAQVNRYAVERVASSLMLGFFFPGAALEPLRDRSGGLPVPMTARRAVTS